MKPRVPTLLHFGEKDQHIPVAGVREVAAAHPEVDVHIYPADHGFNCDHRESYDAPSAALAWSRTLAFLRKHLGERRTLVRRGAVLQGGPDARAGCRFGPAEPLPSIKPRPAANQA